jgi:hypothetical protein
MATAKEKLTRLQKAQKCYDQGIRAVEIGPNSWQVQGTTGTYNVRNEYDIWSCECSDFHYRGGYVLCWHIELVRLCLADISETESKTCGQCARATNLHAPYLYCDRDRAHYPHERKACTPGFIDLHEIERDAQVPDLVVA